MALLNLSPQSQCPTFRGALQSPSPSHLRRTPAPRSFSGQSWARGQALRPQTPKPRRMSKAGETEAGNRHYGHRHRPRKVKKRRQKHGKNGTGTDLGRGDLQEGKDGRGRALATARRQLEQAVGRDPELAPPLRLAKPKPRPLASQPRTSLFSPAPCPVPTGARNLLVFLYDHNPFQPRLKLSSSFGPTRAPNGRAGAWLRPHSSISVPSTPSLVPYRHALSIG